jgi:hypothetical protein
MSAAGLPLHFQSRQITTEARWLAALSCFTGVDGGTLTQIGTIQIEQLIGLRSKCVQLLPTLRRRIMKRTAMRVAFECRGITSARVAQMRKTMTRCTTQTQYSDPQISGRLSFESPRQRGSRPESDNLAPPVSDEERIARQETESCRRTRSGGERSWRG